MITIFADNKEISVKWVEFSDGALSVNVDPIINQTQRYVAINVSSRCNVREIKERLSLLQSAIQPNILKDIPVILNLPYLPYARADRVFNTGDSYGLATFLSVIDNNFYNELNVVDVHNEKAFYNALSCANIDTRIVHITPQRDAFLDAVRTETFNPIKSHNWSFVVAPDKGAVDKAKSIADELKIPLVTATKERDLSTGKIINTTFDANLSEYGKNALIVDDILDGGGTFIPLAQILKEHGCNVELYVTHLIGAKGLNIFKGVIDKIYCYQTVGEYLNKITVSHYNHQQ